MVLALIFVIAVFILVAFFAGFNLQNVCDVWFFGRTFQSVPVFITVLISFAAGILVTLPSVLFKKTKKLSPEQIRAQAERLEQQQKKKQEHQLRQQRKLASTKERIQRLRNKSNKSIVNTESQNVNTISNAAQEENK